MRHTKTDPASLKGRNSFSYARYSDINQGAGSTLARQFEILEQIVKKYMLKDNTEGARADYIDKGKPASNGANRRVGKLGAICRKLGFDPVTLAPTGKPREIPEGWVLIIESIDRLVREPFHIALPLILKIIDSGILIIVGSHPDLIWDAATINGPEHYLLIAEIDRAYEQARRLSDMQLHVRKEQRERCLAIQNGEKDAPLPLVNSTPGWLKREGTRDRPSYTEIERNVRTLKAIFKMAAKGMSLRQIANALNDEPDKYPFFGQIHKKRMVAV